MPKIPFWCFSAWTDRSGGRHDLRQCLAIAKAAEDARVLVCVGVEVTRSTAVDLMIGAGVRGIRPGGHGWLALATDIVDRAHGRDYGVSPVNYDP